MPSLREQLKSLFKSKKFLSRLVGGGLLFSVVFVLYCLSLLPEIERLMALAPELRPTVIYSDTFTVKKGDLFPNLFLTERLKDLQADYTQGKDFVEWRSREFSYPEALLPLDSPLRLKTGLKITVGFRPFPDDERVHSIQVDGKEIDAVALEPTPAAVLSGAQKSIRNYVKLDEIPTPLLQAIIAIEDQRFLEHVGFDPRSFARAIWINLRSRSYSQGGSTITQQLIKNLLGNREKTVFRKVRELILALMVEARYSKDVILEKYLNEVYFGQIGSLEVHGVSEAARYFFNKPISKLELAEIALIAGVIRGPVVYSPYRKLDRALERKNLVLNKMLDLELISQQEHDIALTQPLRFAPVAQSGNKAPYFADYVKAQVLDELHEKISAEDLSAQGLRIFTTLDLPLQRRADKAVLDWVRELEARYKIERPLRLEGLLVAADPATGFVKALLGGRSYAETNFNRVLNMKRQVGSTFKPIVYLSALLKGRDQKGVPYSGAYRVLDEPWTYEYEKGTWSPKNYEKTNRGEIGLREAFAQSINIPMAKIGLDVGLNQIASVARKLGIHEKLAEVPSLTLGSVEMSPMDLLHAYATIANRGERVDLTTVRAVIDGNGVSLARYIARREQVFEPAAFDILHDLLREVVRSGTAHSLSAMGYTKTSRGKTGTTNFYRDAWFAGFSQGLVAISWAGFDELKVPAEDDEKAMAEFKTPAMLTGAGGALPIWARFFMAAKPARHEDPDPSIDSSIERVEIDRSSGLRVGNFCPRELIYTELFLPGSAPSSICNKH